MVTFPGYSNWGLAQAAFFKYLFIHWFPLEFYKPFINHVHTRFLLTVAIDPNKQDASEEIRRDAVNEFLKSSPISSLLSTMISPNNPVVLSIVKKELGPDFLNKYQLMMKEKTTREVREWLFVEVSTHVFEAVTVANVRDYSTKFFDDKRPANSSWYKRGGIQAMMGTFQFVNQFQRGHDAYSDLWIAFMLFIGIADTVLIKKKLTQSDHLSFGKSVTHVINCPNTTVCVCICGRSWCASFVLCRCCTKT